MQNFSEKYNYQRYLELGGIINEKDYTSALTRSKDSATFNESTTKQAENIAKFAGIELHNTEDAIDEKIILYGILHDIKPKETLDSDWRLFREVLRMLEDTDSLSKLKIACHTNRRPGTYCPLCGQIEFSEDCP